MNDVRLVPHVSTLSSLQHPKVVGKGWSGAVAASILRCPDVFQALSSESGSLKESPFMIACYVRDEVASVYILYLDNTQVAGRFSSDKFTSAVKDSICSAAKYQ